MRWRATAREAAKQARRPWFPEVDPLADAEVVETELMLADLESLEKRRTGVEKKAKGNDKDAKVTLDNDVTKLSIVGAGMETHPGVATKMFEALFEHDINIQMIATSEIKISVLIDKKDADRAVKAVHDAFFA